MKLIHEIGEIHEIDPNWHVEIIQLLNMERYARTDA